MPAPLSDQDMKRMLSERRVAVLATIAKDGTPALAPIWFLYRDGAFVMRAAAASVKAKHIRRDPCVTVCVQDERVPYRSITAWGIAEIGPYDPQLASEMARHYLGGIAGKAYANGEPEPAVTITIRPARIVSQDFGSDTPPAARAWLALKRVLPPSV